MYQLTYYQFTFHITSVFHLTKKLFTELLLGLNITFGRSIMFPTLLQ
jgi:hypothetical protein